MSAPTPGLEVTDAHHSLTPTWRLSCPNPGTHLRRRGVDVTVKVTREGDVEVIIGDETGYSPDVVDDFCSRARETALATHRELHPADA